MALFTRRVIQNCLDENAEFVSNDTLRDWVRRLNKVSNDYVAAEWEVILLRAFAMFGKVLHEPPLGKRPIDLIFESLDGELKFAADIAAISDQPLHDKNPIDRFQEELDKRIKKAKIDTGRFVFRVEEEQPVAQRGTGRKRRLLLPAVSQFPIYVFNTAFDKYIEMVRNVPQQGRDHHVLHHSPAVDITIQYQPGIGRGVSCHSYGSYTSTTVKDDNPLFNRLKAKAAQLKQSGYDGIRGIIVCDRGSRIFAEMPHWSTYKVDEVVGEFFRQHESVAFVATVGIESNPSMFGGRFHHNFERKLFVRDTRKDWVSRLDRLFSQVISSLPAIHQTPENAMNSLKWNNSTKHMKPFLGGSILKGNEIRISARELLDLLAGRLDQKRFAENHDMGGGNNIFSLYRAQGKMIKRAEVERLPQKDDDWVILEFSAGDPAVSDFTVPKSGNAAQREEE
ncbi:MAG TPA: hypothetical protein VND66_13350 [Acidobacteriaceae bacterium]|nr:hypothetical protein [Acidobacteriaceae bacterium]